MFGDQYLLTKHAAVEVSDQTVETRLIKHGSNNEASAKHVCMIESLMAVKFIKPHDQTR